MENVLGRRRTPWSRRGAAVRARRGPIWAWGPTQPRFGMWGPSASVALTLWRCPFDYLARRGRLVFWFEHMGSVGVHNPRVGDSIDVHCPFSAGLGPAFATSPMKIIQQVSGVN